MTGACSSPLDRIDRRILALLRRDGRLGNAELARKVNLGPASRHRRSRRLLAQGVIRSARAAIAISASSAARSSWSAWSSTARRRSLPL